MASLTLRFFRYRHLNTLLRKSSSFGGREPWLMIERYGGEDGSKKFYSLVDEQVVDVMSLESESVTVVGSSHGWLASYENRRKKGSWGSVRSTCRSGINMFLHNPVHYGPISLPRVETLPVSTKESDIIPKKVILSSPPNSKYQDESCRAIMSYGQEHRLAYCCPNKHWAPIGDLFHENEPINERLGLTRVPRVYEDFVYSTTKERLFCVTKYGNFECWDLRDTRRPVMNWKKKMDQVGDDYYYSKKYLVFAERSSRLFVVHCRSNVTGFFLDVDELNAGKKGGGEVIKRCMDGGSLDGMAFFIGSCGHGFVLEKDEVIKNNVKPNCIYLAENNNREDNNKVAYGCIFNYENKTFSPCYTHPPCDDIQSDKRPRIQSAPVWFTPCSMAYLHSMHF